MIKIKVAIIDADLIGRKKHRFPNLVCMKLSSYYKSIGADVELKLNYENLDTYDKVTISKVFMDTEIPFEPDDKSLKTENTIDLFYKDNPILNLPNVEYGGTGFYYDRSPNLSDEIEHSFPDYDLYNEWVNQQISNGVKRSEFKEYLDYSIGFLTRGCFRQCKFCVNKKYSHVFCHSPLDEFYDPNRKKICLLDDNFLGYSNWKEMLIELQKINKPFKFKQGLDERLLTDEKCEMLFNSKYDGDITFAFDNVSDYDLIEKKLQLIRKHTNKQIIFYVLCGFESLDEHDIENVFIRIELLMRYGCLPYIMRYENYKNSKHRGMYITLARWCNQFSFYKKNSFREYCRDVKSNGIGSAAYRYMTEFEKDFPDIAEKYFDMKFEELNRFK